MPDTKRGILWFRSDLRIHDNEALIEAARAVDEVIPLYVFDEHNFERGPYGFQSLGAHRAHFLLGSVAALRDKLRTLGSDLIVLVGRPEKIVFEIACRYKTHWVFCNRERTPQEVGVQDALEKNLWTVGQEVRYSRGKMLYHTADLPFPITHVPDTFAGFRREVEKFLPIRLPLEVVESGLPFPECARSEVLPIPTMVELGFSGYDPSEVAFRGGEEDALGYLDDRISALAHAEPSGLQISPWLSAGALSPKVVYHAMERMEGSELVSVKKEIQRNLMLRDFYRLMGKKHREKLFDHAGLAEKEVLPHSMQEVDYPMFISWVKGETKNDFVNAIMRELGNTGFVAHQLRRVASYYLVQRMEIPWLYGAAYFESALIDYDPMSNYGNWQRVGGVSLDQSGETEVNYEAVEKQFDPHGLYKEKWLKKEVTLSFFDRL